MSLPELSGLKLIIESATLMILWSIFNKLELNHGCPTALYRGSLLAANHQSWFARWVGERKQTFCWLQVPYFSSCPGSSQYAHCYYKHEQSIPGKLSIYVSYLSKSCLKEDKALVTTFGVCHMLGMASAVANPVLYSFLNKNFRQVTLRNICFLKNFLLFQLISLWSFTYLNNQKDFIMQYWYYAFKCSSRWFKQNKNHWK